MCTSTHVNFFLFLSICKYIPLLFLNKNKNFFSVTPSLSFFPVSTDSVVAASDFASVASPLSSQKVPLSNYYDPCLLVLPPQITQRAKSRFILMHSLIIYFEQICISVASSITRCIRLCFRCSGLHLRFMPVFFI